MRFFCALERRIMNSISVVIPCYNEEEVLELTYRTVSKVLKKIGREYEIVFVNDGSIDSTWQLIKRFSKRDGHVGGVCLSRNRGRESALMAGFEHVKGDIVVCMDADLQDPPALLPKMLELMEKGGYDQVGTLRKNRDSQSKLVGFLSESYYKTFNLFSKKVKIKVNEREYRMMRKEVVDAILAHKEKVRYMKAIWSQVGYKTTYIEYEDVERAAGKSKYSIPKLWNLGVNYVLDYAEYLLRTPVYFGLVLFLISIICLFINSISGTLKIILFGFSFVFIFMGLLGIYVSKIYTETKNRPLYIASEVIKSNLNTKGKTCK